MEEFWSVVLDYNAYIIPAALVGSALYVLWKGHYCGDDS